MIDRIHTCFITYNRFELTVRAVASYLETVTWPYTWVVVDNGSTDGTVEWLQENEMPHIALGENRYPGFACNRGWEQAPDTASFFHRADNDFIFLPGWCEQLEERFRFPVVGQVGMRTHKEENGAKSNVGGNNVIRRALWEKGLRYDERPWGAEYPPGWTEDSLLSPEVLRMGYKWARVKKPCIVPISSEDPNDPYYQDSWAKRGIKPPA